MKIACLVVLLAAVACASPSGFAKILKDKLNGQAVAVDPFIIGGETAAEKAAPYMVSFSASSLVYAHGCGGTLLNKEWVLTAAHCINELKTLAGSPIGLPVFAGLTDRNNTEAAQVRTIDFAFNHKEFTGVEGSPDIALVHVTPAFEFGDSVQPITLPSKGESYAGNSSSNYGWGLDDPEAVIFVKDLQVAKSNVLTQKECSEALPSDAPVTRKHICVKTIACFGDGGSPLVIERTGNVAELAGITSWGYLPCGYNNRPTIYTAVAEYVDWIIEVQWAYYVLH